MVTARAAEMTIDEAEESVASYEDFDDATFEAIIAGMTKIDEKKKAGYKAKMEEKKDDKKEEEVKAEEVEAEVEAEEAEAEVAAEEALEDTETSEAALVDASNEEDELSATRASVAEWLENNVLNK